MIFNILLASTILFSVSSQECYGLALAGGGAKGAYEAGVLLAFANATNAPFMQYNIVSGISIGALNCALISQYSMGDELNMANYMVNSWRAITGTSDIYVEWKGGLIDGLLFQRGLYDNSPAIELGRTWMKTASKRNITVGSTNLDTGEFGVFTENLGYALIDGIAASASIPFIFPPHNFEGYSWADGSVISNLDIPSAIERCLAVTSNQSQIIMDIIYDGGLPVLPEETKFKTIDVMQRESGIRAYDSGIWYYYNTQIAYPEVKFRYSVSASEGLPAPLNFSKESIEFGIELGIKDGINALNKKSSGRAIIAELYNENRSKVIYP